MMSDDDVTSPEGTARGSAGATRDAVVRSLDAGGDERFEAALRLAAIVHAHQVRKGTRIPYVTHTVAVARMLEQAGQPLAVVLAGLLHDAIEDAHDSDHLRDALRATFPGAAEPLANGDLRHALSGLIEREVGADVLRLVQAVTEKKEEAGQRRPWKVRKDEQLAHLAVADPHVLALKAADALHNARAIRLDSIETQGGVFARFNASADDVLWYHGAVAAIASERLGSDDVLARDLARECDLLAHEVDRVLGPRDASGRRAPTT